MNPLVSIIIPTYNRCDLIGETLDSVIFQTFINWECIVVDDGSTDYTKELLEFYCSQDLRIKYFHRPTNRIKGANACRNYGFENSLGKYINWFDDDDLMKAEKLSNQLQQLEDSSFNFTVCQSTVFIHFPSNSLGFRKEHIYSENFFNDFICNRIKWLTQAPLFKKEFLLTYNLKFDESLVKSQERDFFVKVLFHTKSYLYDYKPYVLLRKHEKSISYSGYSSSKQLSTFKVDFSIIQNYQNYLDFSSKLYLKKSLKNCIVLSLRNGDEISGKKMMKDILLSKITSGWYEKLNLVVGYFCLVYLKRGEIFFK